MGSAVGVETGSQTAGDDLVTEQADPFRKLYDRALGVVDRDSLEYLLELNSEYSVGADSDSIPERPAIKLLRSIASLSVRLPGVDIGEGTRAVVELMRSAPKRPLPLPQDFESHLVAAFRGATSLEPHTQRGVSLSTPVASKTVSINLVKRFFNEDLRLTVRLRLGLSIDVDHRPCWDLGCVYVPKSIEALSRTSVTPDTLRARGKITVEMLEAGKHGLLDLIAHDPIVQVLDLSPQYYFVEPLARYFGAVHVDPERWRAYSSRLVKAVDWTFRCHPELVSRRSDLAAIGASEASRRRFDPVLVSLLLYNHLILDPDTGCPFVWISPRMIYRGRREN